jgi:hypothetical protein
MTCYSCNLIGFLIFSAVSVLKLVIDCFVLYELVRLIIFFNKEMRKGLKRHNALLDENAVK